jgi:hypothetical protein
MAIGLINLGLSFFIRSPFGPLFSALYASVSASLRSRAALQLEILALRHQLGVLQRSVKRPKLTPADRMLWAGLCVVWNDWRANIFLVKAATVIGWHRKGFRFVLDLENSVRQAGTTCGAKGSPRLDSYDEPRQFALGCPADSR